MDLYLVRHGETESNKEKRYKGWTESPLSPKGISQAEKAGLFLGGKNIEGLYCSDLQRTLNTARIIGSCCGIKPVASQLLREIHFGQWEGLTYREIEAGWGNQVRYWLDDPFKRSAPGGETMEKVRARMLSFITKLNEQFPEQQRVVLVSHGGSIRVLLHHVLGFDRKNFWEIAIDNASISLITRENEKVKVVYYNRVDHLEAGVKEEGG